MNTYNKYKNNGLINRPFSYNLTVEKRAREFERTTFINKVIKKIKEKINGKNAG
jgi:hypothetical protein